jgi:hypothetical protein
MTSPFRRQTRQNENPASSNPGQGHCKGPILSYNLLLDGALSVAWVRSLGDNCEKRKKRKKKKD